MIEYSPFIKEYIYRNNWEDLNSIQKEASNVIFNTDNDIIIASTTASGKTEAAFFPILTLLDKNPSKSISVLYISPLKALINDQFSRLDDLLKAQDIPVWPWHGDISYSKKLKAQKINKGILQITPESLESLVMRHPSDVKKLFSDLRYIIIDEVHSFFGTDRGLQLISVIERIERIIRRRPRRIGLSATLKDYKSAQNFLSSGKGDEVITIGLDSKPRPMRLSVETFKTSDDQDDQLEVKEELNNYIYDRTNEKSLIFTNSKKETESIIYELERINHLRGDNRKFLVHHGSLSAALRKDAEETLKEKEPVTAAATSSLELGIDIGDLNNIVQIGAPPSCSSFVQRLGRSGRKTGFSQMRFVSLYEESKKGLESLPWDLLKTISILDLYIKERFIESPKDKEKPFSLLVHQTLSYLLSLGDIKPNILASQILTLSPFKEKITKEEYKEILNYLIENEFIQKLEDGNLILGLKGERLVNNYNFLAVFNDNREIRVYYDSEMIGTIAVDQPVLGEIFVLGGRAWKIIKINERNNTVQVKPSRSSKVPKWHGTAIDVDDRVLENIESILESDNMYPFLQGNAQMVLHEARFNFSSYAKINKYIYFSDGLIYFIPWKGTKIVRTLMILLKTIYKSKLEIKSVYNYNYFLGISTKLDAREFFERLKRIDLNKIGEDYDKIFMDKPILKIDKFDYLLPEDIQETSYLQNVLDLKGAVKFLESIKK